MKIVNAGSCPLKGKKPQKQQLKVLSQQAESGKDATLSTKNRCSVTEIGENAQVGVCIKAKIGLKTKVRVKFKVYFSS